MTAPRFSPARRILIVLLGAIGDVVRALPLLPRLRRAYPEAELAWAVEPPARELVAAHPLIERVFLFERPRGARAFFRFLREVRAYRPDLCLDLQRHLKSGLTAWWSGAPVRLGFARENSREGNWWFSTHHIPPQDHFRSKLLQYQEFADFLGAPSLPVDFGLALRDEEERRVQALLADVPRPFAAAFVGSSWPSRFWFPERTARVAEALNARGIATVLVGASNEQPFARAVREEARCPIFDLTGQTTLRDLIGIFRCAEVAWGPDSGPMHIAAAAGARVVSLWGATSPRRSAPFGNEAGVIAGSAPCAPCYRRRCPIGRLCMQNITVEQVVEALLAAERSGGTAG